MRFYGVYIHDESHEFSAFSWLTDTTVAIHMQLVAITTHALRDTII